MTSPQSRPSPEKKLMLEALTGVVTRQIPFWLMRQAGRYLPEYRALRQEAGSFLDLCFNPELAAEVTLQPLRRFDMDAAILFSDILVVPYALGQALSFVEGEGPRLGQMPSATTIDKIGFKEFDLKLSPIYETIRRVRKSLTAEKTLIGFAGAPWTIACYMLQGRGDGKFDAARQFAIDHPSEFGLLMKQLVTFTAHYLIEQIRHGADAVQIFDSWAGLVPEQFFQQWVVQPTRRIADEIHKNYPGFPVIGFPRNAGTLYPQYADGSGVCCVGLDQSISIEEASSKMSGRVTLQGNLDPETLLAGGKKLEESTRLILAAAGQNPFIFNLGHGVIKETPPEHVLQLSRIIQEYRR